MAQQSGGDLRITSQLTLGTTITLYFPAVEDGEAVREDARVDPVR